MSPHRRALIFLAFVTACERPSPAGPASGGDQDRKSTRLNSSHSQISYAVFCLKKKNLYIRQFHRPWTCSDVFHTSADSNHYSTRLLNTDVFVHHYLHHDCIVIIHKYI